MPTSEAFLHVKLGVPVSNFEYDEENKRLFVSGPAIEEGVWIGMDNIPRFYPREVLQASAILFNGVPLVCEHRGLKIGNVVRTKRTALGFRIEEAYITDTASIQAVLSGSKTGFSIEAAISMNPVRLIVDRIAKAINVSLVEEPACRVCGITDAYLVKNAGKKIMTEEITEEVTTETSASPEVIQESPVEQVIEAQVTDPVIESNTNTIFEELKLAASKFKDLQQKMTELLIGYNLTSIEPIIETNVAMSTEQTEVPVIETEVEAVTEQQKVEEISTVEIEETPVIDTNIDGVTERVTELENTLVSVTEMISGMVNQFEQFGDQLIGLSAQVKTITEEKIALSEQNETERTSLIEEIKQLDPETDDELVNDMSITQLSAYKKKVESWRQPKAGGERKVVPQDKQARKPGTITVNRIDVINGIISELKNKTI